MKHNRLTRLACLSLSADVRESAQALICSARQPSFRNITEHQIRVPSNSKLILTAIALACSFNQAVASTQPTSLQKYEVDQLKVWHILRSPYSGKLVAWIMDPEGYTHHLEVAETLGKHDGVVYKITKCAVFFKELASDNSGGWVEVRRSLRSPDCAPAPK